MNKVWGILILFSLAAALFTDVRERITDRWENRRTWKATVLGTPGWSDSAPLQLVLDGTQDTLQVRYSRPPGAALIFTEAGNLPETLKKRFDQRKDTKSGLRTRKLRIENSTVHFDFEPLAWLKMTAIADAAFDMAKTAVTLALGLIGAMALWLGLMRIAEQSGMIGVVVRIVQPLMRRLFPDVPKDSPALGAISLNLAANVLGLGNAATPLGIKAMEELKKLAPESEEASHAMCMFLAINTSSVQLLPPVTLVALMGTGVAPLMVSITLATIVSTATAIMLAFWQRNRSMKHG